MDFCGGKWKKKKVIKKKQVKLTSQSFVILFIMEIFIRNVLIAMQFQFVVNSCAKSINVVNWIQQNDGNP